MASADRETVTRLLGEAADGRVAAAEELLPLVYDELRRLAGSFFRDQPREHTLEPTALVHEAYVKLVDRSAARWESRNQFFVIAAKAMRSILVDHARGKGRLKRGGDRARVTLRDAADRADGVPHDLHEIEALDDALSRLAALDDRKARLVELRFFGGLSADAAADLLGIARSTAAEDWRMARAWLQAELEGRTSG